MEKRKPKYKYEFNWESLNDDKNSATSDHKRWKIISTTIGCFFLDLTFRRIFKESEKEKYIAHTHTHSLPLPVPIYCLTLTHKHNNDEDIVAALTLQWIWRWKNRMNLFSVFSLLPLAPPSMMCDSVFLIPVTCLSYFLLSTFLLHTHNTYSCSWLITHIHIHIHPSLLSVCWFFDMTIFRFLMVNVWMELKGGPSSWDIRSFPLFIHCSRTEIISHLFAFHSDHSIEMRLRLQLRYDKWKNSFRRKWRESYARITWS